MEIVLWAASDRFPGEHCSLNMGWLSRGDSISIGSWPAWVAWIESCLTISAAMPVQVNLGLDEPKR